MAPVTLPPSFHNSFWSTDFRTGLDVLFRQLESGCIENKDIAAFIESQARAHHNLSAALLEPPLGTNGVSTSSLQHTLLSLRGASAARGEAHRSLALELEERVLMPFQGWRMRHEDRVEGARNDLLSKNGVVSSWEKEVNKLSGLRQAYLVKSRAADDSEDDAKFAPAISTSSLTPPDSYTASPPPKMSPLRRTGTVADRISEKLKAASVLSPTHHRSQSSIDGKALPSAPVGAEPMSPTPLPRLRAVERDHSQDGLDSPTREDTFIPPSDPHGRPTIITELPPPVPGKDEGTSPLYDVPLQPLLLSGLSLQVQGLKDLVARFQVYLQTNAAPGSESMGELSSKVVLASRQRSTILGTYEKTFSGEEAASWLRDNVEGFGGDWERCVDAAGELQRMGYLARIGVGRGFEPTDDTFYTLRIHPGEGGPVANLHLPPSLSNLSANTTAATANLPSLLKSYKSYLPASLASSDEPAHLRLRREAGKADESYREGVRTAEDRRLEMEEKIERGLRLWERWERERLAVVRTVLKQYEETLAKLPKKLADLQPGTSIAVEAFNPDADLKALIEGSRTGPYRPRPHVYESIEADLPEVYFGVDLRRWAGDLGWKSLVKTPQRAKDAIPEALDGLLTALDEMYDGIPDEERRRAWIYEVPLHETHLLRNTINNSALSIDDITAIVKKFNVPIAAGTVKLFLLELNPPVLGWEGWEDAKAVYPSIGADQERDMTSAVTSVLGRLPGPQLFTLNAIVKHFKELIESTKSEEPIDVYTTKLSLSVGRCILRPQYETELSIQDRTPSLFLADMINHYEAVFPPLLEKKKSQADRVMPVRKRTALVDQRISRSRLSGEVDSHELLEHQHSLQHPPRSVSPVPELPEIAKSPFKFPVVASEIASFSPDTSLSAEPKTIEDNIKIVPPTPEVPFEDRMSPSPGIPTPPTPAHKSAPASRSQTPMPGDDEAVTPTGSAPALKRATSGETSRLRGPKGARGPRPAPGHGSRGSVSAAIAQFEQRK